MKNPSAILFLTLISVAFSYCSQPKSIEKSVSLTSITGTIEGGDGQQLFINRINSKSQGKIIDTINIGEKGLFTHTLAEALPLDYYVITAKNRKQFYLVTDSTESITINADYDNLSQPNVISGSKHTEIYRTIFKKVASYKEDLKALNDEIIAAPSVAEKKSIGSRKKGIKDEFRKELDSFIDNNASSPGIAGFFDAMDFSKEPKLSAKVINNLAKSVPNTNYYKAREAQVKQIDNPNVRVAKSPDIGKVAPNIVLDDPNGNEITLYELRGKTVLVDFWASWCGPCRRENPNVVNAYKKYHDAGFEVLSVSLDNNKDKWVKAIEEDGLIWSTHVSDLLKWDTPYKEKYGFSGIPHAVLVDTGGTIIDSKIRGAKLEERLEEIFGY
ncbi:MAG: thioredoxin-like domain-containing protein [Flavobacteriales bacterium]